MKDKFIDSYNEKIKNIEKEYENFEKFIFSNEEKNLFNKLQPYLKNLEKSKLDLNNYISKLGKNGEHTKSLEYIVYNLYPKLVDKNYDRKILEHIILQQFYDPKESINIKTKSDYNIFKLNAVQKMLRNFLGPNTPYNNMLLIHDPGVGKTCTAITIAENIKNYTRMNNRRIFIVRPDEFNKQLFEIEKVKNKIPHLQCTGTTYLEEVKNTNPINEDYLLECVKGDEESCNRLKKNINNEIKKYYQFSNLIKWAKTINAEIEQKTSGVKSEKERLAIKIKVIRSLFNNNLLIIDEAHKLRDDSASGDEDERLVVRILNEICLYSQNMKLLLLTATPMYDKPTEIIQLLNFMLLNDKRPLLKEKEIFANDEGELLPQGSQKLIYAIKGYVSYMRGNNPDEFPIRLDADVNLSEKNMYLPSSKKTKYPVKTITGEKILKKNQIKYMKLTTPTYEKEQQKVITNININEEGEIIQGVAYQAELQASNFIYQTMSDSGNVAKECYGTRGLNNTTIFKNGRYTFKNPEFAKELLGDNLKKYSTKYHLLLQNIKKSKGPVFIYSNFIAGGILPLTFILELNGYKRYNGDQPFLQSSYKSTEKMGEYIFFTGSERKSVAKYLNKRENMVNEPVKVFICSAVANEGLNLFGYRESHILDPWYNMSSMEQTIGRCIRRRSHLHLPAEERNVVIYLYAGVFGGKLKEIESYDLHVYNIVEKKAINTGTIQKIIKENAIDCAILKKNNTRLKKDYPDKVDMTTSSGKKIKVELYDKPFTVTTFFQDEISDKCSTDKYESKANFNMELDTILDFDISLLDIDIREVLEIIKIELIRNGNLLFDDIIKIINDNLTIKYDKITILKILEIVKSYYENNKVKIINNLGETSQIISSPDGIRLLNLENINPIQSIQQQMKTYEKMATIPLILKDSRGFKKINDIDIMPFVKELQKSKQLTKSKSMLNYNKIIDNLLILFNNIKDNIKEDKLNTVSLKVSNNKVICKYLFDKLLYKEKLFILKEFVNTIITDKIGDLSSFEKDLIESIRYNIVYNQEIVSGVEEIDTYQPFDKIKNNIYGFIIANKISLTLYKYNFNSTNKENLFTIDKGKVNKIINERYSIIKSQNINKLFGFTEYNKSEYLKPIFKIIDYESKGVKKSVKGIACSSKLISNILEYISNIGKGINLDFKYKNKNKHINCNNLQFIMRIKSSDKLRDIDETLYYLNPEQFWIWRYKTN